MINVTSKNIKNTVNDLNNMQLNYYNTNSTATLRQSLLSIDINSKKIDERNKSLEK